MALGVVMTPFGSNVLSRDQETAKRHKRMSSEVTVTSTPRHKKLELHACLSTRAKFRVVICKRERRWFVSERPRRDTNGGSETEVTVTSKLQANAERNKEIQSLRDRLSLSVLEDGSRKA